MTEPGNTKSMVADQNEIDPASLFAGYQTLAPLGGDRSLSVMNSLEATHGFKAEAPRGPESLVRAVATANNQTYKPGGVA